MAGSERGETFQAAVPSSSPSELEALLAYAHACSSEYARDVADRRVTPDAAALHALEQFDVPLPDGPANARDTIRMLHEFGSPATVAQTGGRYFGFVNGGVVPEALAARWLIDTWDQNTAFDVMSPIGARLEQVCERWLVDLLQLPDGTAAGFTNGTSAALICSLAAARHALLKRQGWDVASEGLHGAPRLRVVASTHTHAAALRALQVLGLGTKHLELAPTDDQGRIVATSLPPLDDTTLVLAQAGNVNSGSFDPLRAIGQRTQDAGAWLHVDGAFGLWAAASRRTRHLTDGLDLADSWSVDAHKTLNAPYDNGIALCRHRDIWLEALRMNAAYLVRSDQRDGMDFTLDMSRRARGAELWATLHALGRSGVERLVDHLCAMARRLADALQEHGFHVPHDVVFNQVLVTPRDETIVPDMLSAIQRSGVCWCGGSTWHGAPVIRVSICSHRTTPDDIDRTVAAFVDARHVVTGA